MWFYDAHELQVQDHEVKICKSCHPRERVKVYKNKLSGSEASIIKSSLCSTVENRSEQKYTFLRRW